MPASPPDSYGAEDWAPTSGAGSGGYEAEARRSEARRSAPRRHAQPDDEEGDLSTGAESSGGWRTRPAPVDLADGFGDSDGRDDRDGRDDADRWGADADRWDADRRDGDADRWDADRRDADADAGRWDTDRTDADAGRWDADADGRGDADHDEAALPPVRPDRPVPAAPVHRVLSLAMAGLSGLLAVAMVVGAQLTPEAYALVVFGAQVLFVVVWTVASQPPGGRIVAGVGIAVAVNADLASVVVNPASLAPLAFLTAGGFVFAVIGQLLRPAGRVRVTESLGSSLVVVVGVVALATLIVLGRRPLGDQVIVAIVVGAGAALLVAHLVDTLAPVPRVAPSVPRGGAGVVAGAMAGTAAAGLAGHFLEGLSPLPTALAGLAAAVIALMIDLSANYAEASRRLAGGAPALWLVRHMQGPLSAFALAAPVAYAASLVLARGL